VKPIEVGGKMVSRPSPECVCSQCGTLSHMASLLYAPVTVIRVQALSTLGIAAVCGHPNQVGHNIWVRHDWLGDEGLASG